MSTARVAGVARAARAGGWLGRRLLTALVVLIVLLALCLTLLRLTVFAAPQLQPHIESRLSSALGQPVTMGRLAVRWRGMTPQIVLQDLLIGPALDPMWQSLAGDPRLRHYQAGGLSVRELRIDLDLRRSLERREAVVTSLELAGLLISVQRDEDGMLSLLGLDLGDDEPDLDLDVMAVLDDLLRRSLNLRLVDSRLRLVDPGRGLVREMQGLALSLQPLDGGGQQLAGRARLPAQWGDQVAFALNWGEPGVRPLLEDRIEAFAEITGLRSALMDDLFGMDRNPGDGPRALFSAAGNLRLWATLDGGLPGLPGPSGHTGHAAGNEAARVDRSTSATQRSGTLSVVGNEGTLTLPALFRNPLGFDDLALAGRWRVDVRGWQLDVDEAVVDNQVGRISARTSVAGRRGQPLFIDLRANVAGTPGNARHTSDYLPAGIMRQGLVNWLDRAIVSGTAERAEVLFHGHGVDFPFADGSGHFEVRADARDMTLDYLVDWPPLTELDAELHFLANSMRISASDGRISGARLLQAEAAIPAFGSRPLGISGRVRGQGQHMLDFLMDMPLSGEGLGKVLAGMRLNGEQDLDLELQVPFDGRPVAVQGRVSMEQSDFSVPAWGLSLDDLGGSVDFNRKGIQDADLRGRFHGAPLLLGAETLDTVAGRRTRLHGDAVQLPLTALHGFVPGTDFLSGKGNVEIIADLPAFNGDQDPDYPVRLRFNSDMVGIANNMPAPMGKAAADDMPLSVEFGAGSGIGPVQIRYGHLAGIALELDPKGGGLERVGIHLGPEEGKGKTPLPPGPGASLSGLTHKLDVDGWLAWQPGRGNDKNKNQGNNRGNHQGGPPARQPITMRWLDFHAVDLTLGGLSWPDLSVSGERDRGWDIILQGPAVAGSLYLPMEPGSSEALRLDLSYLRLQQPLSELDPRLSRIERESGELPDTLAFAASAADLPPISADIADLQIMQRPLGRLQFRGSPDGSGDYRLHELTLNGPDNTLEASGSWRRKSTELKFLLSSGDVGRVLAAWGYPEVIRGGRGRFKGDLSWPGAPVDMAPQALSGDLRLSLREGHLLQVEPGAGRLFGLLSVTMLPRRLSLNFSDVLDEGFAFDRLVADFSLDSGYASPRELYMDGPAARVSAEGGVDLAAQTLDQTVSVVPKASATLPLIGGLMGGPPAAAALFVAQQLLQGVDGVARQSFRMTGSWDDPEIVRIGRAEGNAAGVERSAGDAGQQDQP